MTELDRAITDISSIRRQVAQTTEFRGYGPAALTGTAALALAAAGAQHAFLPNPAANARAYLAIWIATAFFSAILIAAEMHARTRRIHTGLADEMIRMAVEQFVPSIAVGGLLTFVLLHFVHDSLWMLPALWQIIYALGILSSCRFLPRLMIAAGLWYLFTGFFSLSLADTRALAPSVMGVSFAAGQLLMAAILTLTHKEDSDAL